VKIKWYRGVPLSVVLIVLSGVFFKKLADRRLQPQGEECCKKNSSGSLSSSCERGTISREQDLKTADIGCGAKIRNEIQKECCETSSCLPPYGACSKFNAHLDFLFWRADQDGLEYGTKIIAGPIIGSSSKTKTKLLDLHFDWDPGFRVGIGYLFKHFDYWAVNLDWTHIHNHAHGKSSAQGIESQVGDINTIISPWVNLLFELRVGASKAHAHWNLGYDTLDLVTGRSFGLSNRIALNPYFGFRAGLIDQRYRAKYESVFILAESAPPFKREVVFKGKNVFAGFGLRGGGELLWSLSRHWHLFSQLSGNILYGKFTVHMKNLHDQGLGEGDVPPMPLDFFAKEHFWRVRLNFEEAIGLGWERFFRRDRYHLSIRVAYEMSQWLNQNELFYTFYFRGQDTISSVPIRSQGDLSFHGVQAGVRFDF
jgi:hypothetical protein